VNNDFLWVKGKYFCDKSSLSLPSLLGGSASHIGYDEQHCHREKIKGKVVSKEFSTFLGHVQNWNGRAVWIGKTPKGLRGSARQPFKGPTRMPEVLLDVCLA
jgi:hypothetical protein